MNFITLVIFIIGIFVGVLMTRTRQRQASRRLARRAIQYEEQPQVRKAPVEIQRAPVVTRHQRIRCPLCNELECEHDGSDLEAERQALRNSDF